MAQYKVDIDWDKAGALGVPPGVVQGYLSGAFGSSYIGDFVQGGRVKRVYAQADAPFRMLPSDLDRLYVPSTRGGLVPLSALASGRWVYGSPRLERYNAQPAINIQGEAGAGPQLRRGHAGHGGARGQAPEGDRPRVDRPLLPGAHGRVAGRPALRLLGARHLPGPRRALRELDGADLDRSGAAARRAGRRAGVLAARPAQRRLLPDRPAHRPRPDHQERDPDRAVRQDAT